jgi:hypothetical protein
MGRQNKIVKKKRKKGEGDEGTEGIKYKQDAFPENTKLTYAPKCQNQMRCFCIPNDFILHSITNQVMCVCLRGSYTLVLRGHVAGKGKERNSGVLEEKTVENTGVDGKIVLKWTLNK